jgi:lactoylglutathione lyase
MRIKFTHLNIISRDWEKLADFYIQSFQCTPILPKRNLEGEWLDKATSINSAQIRGIHLQLPGFDEHGPTLEIFQYKENDSGHSKKVNTEGFGHIAFRVDDVDEIVNNVLLNGGNQVGEIVSKDIKGLGTITFAYLTDPEGNIIEIQKWV